MLLICNLLEIDTLKYKIMFTGQFWHWTLRLSDPGILQALKCIALHFFSRWDVRSTMDVADHRVTRFVYCEVTNRIP